MATTTPRSAGCRMPAEWEPHAAVWTAWPWDHTLWREDLRAAREAVASMCTAIADWRPEANKCQGETLQILVPDGDQADGCRRMLRGVPANFHRVPFGDIWVRDTGPVFLVDRARHLAAVCFAFNGWGGKFVLANDDQVSRAVVRLAKARAFATDFVFEGGSVDVDGEGTCLTTRQCLLNPNRNKGMSELAVEEKLRESLGVTRIIWLDQGLANDHTDGHVDNLARFVRPGVVACMEPIDEDDPNAAVLRTTIANLERCVDAQGRQLTVARVPSPGRVADGDGNAMPASYLNFYIGNRALVIPTWGASADDAAVGALSRLFPDRRAVGVDARAILAGGGSFHCITQQQPAAES